MVARCCKVWQTVTRGLYPGQLEHNEARIYHHVTLIRQITACPPSTGNCELQPCNTTIMQLILWRYSYYYLLNKHQISLFVPDFICSTMFAWGIVEILYLLLLTQVFGVSSFHIVYIIVACSPNFLILHNFALHVLNEHWAHQQQS